MDAFTPDPTGVVICNNPTTTTHEHNERKSTYRAFMPKYYPSHKKHASLIPLFKISKTQSNDLQKSKRSRKRGNVFSSTYRME